MSRTIQALLIFAILVGVIIAVFLYLGVLCGFIAFCVVAMIYAFGIMKSASDADDEIGYG